MYRTVGRFSSGPGTALLGRLVKGPPTAARGVAVPLTSTQTDMLVQHLLNPDFVGEHCLIGWELDGPINVDVLRRTIEHLHHRHESLRSAYLLEEHAVAELRDVAPPDLIMRTADSRQQAREVLDSLLAKPFRLEDGVIWRVALVELSGTGSSLLCLAAHHIAVDGWSQSILATDLSRVYNALLAGKSPKEDAAPSLSEIAAARPGSEVEELHRAYWLRELAGVPQLAYPGTPDRDDPPGAVTVRVPFSAELFARVRRLARAHRVTPYVVFLTAYGKALADVSGQRDLCIGTPVALRGDEVLDDAVSCLIEVLCVRLRPTYAAVDGNELLVVADTVQNAFSALAVPLSDMSKMVKAPRNGRPRLFQNIFALQNIAPALLDLTGVRCRSFVPAPQALPTELFVEAWEHGTNGPNLTLNYRPAIVPAEAAQDLGRRILAELHELRAV